MCLSERRAAAWVVSLPQPQVMRGLLCLPGGLCLRIGFTYTSGVWESLACDPFGVLKTTRFVS